MSRIHVSIGYDVLDDNARGQIWDNLFQKLEDDFQSGRGIEIECKWDAKEFARDSPKMKALRWNGREIRNGKLQLPSERDPTNV